MFIAPIDWRAAAFGAVTPQLPDAQALTIAVGIVGATVMPHAIYLHSGADAEPRRAPRNDARARAAAALLQPRGAGRAGRRRAGQHGDGGDGGGAFHAGHSDVAEIETAYHTLTPLLGGAAAACSWSRCSRPGFPARSSARWRGR